MFFCFFCFNFPRPFKCTHSNHLLPPYYGIVLSWANKGLCCVSIWLHVCVCVLFPLKEAFHSKLNGQLQLVLSCQARCESRGAACKYYHAKPFAVAHRTRACVCLCRRRCYQSYYQGCLSPSMPRCRFSPLIPVSVRSQKLQLWLLPHSQMSHRCLYKPSYVIMQKLIHVRGTKTESRYRFKAHSQRDLYICCSLR